LPTQTLLYISVRHIFISLTSFLGTPNLPVIMQLATVVASTLFSHKDIHKMTWKYPDGQTFNQIDHLLIIARHVSNVMDVRTFRGANIIQIIIF
jgi:hypothetical protein